eukprot:gene2050-4001_t
MLKLGSSQYGAFDIQAHSVPSSESSTKPDVKKYFTVNMTLWMVILMTIGMCLNFFSKRQIKRYDVTISGPFSTSNGNARFTAFQSPHWTRSESHNVEKTTAVKFYVALILRDSHDLRDELLSVSDPESESYGKHLSIETINHKYGPSVEQQTVVMEYFRGIHGSVVESNLHGDMIRVQASVEHIEKGLDTSLGWHTHNIDSSSSGSSSSSKRNTKALRATRAMSIPEHVAVHISFVSLNSPVLHSLNTPRNSNRVKVESVEVTEEAMDIGGTSVSILRNLYKTPSTSSKRGSQAIVGFYYEFFSNNDLKDFFTRSGLDSSLANIPLSNIYGNLGNFEDSPGHEASMDVQYIMGMAPGIPTYFYSMDALNPIDQVNEGFLEWLFIIGNQAKPPLVHSISYGDTELAIFDPTVSGAEDYGNRVELEFVKMGVRGLTVIAASGDKGVQAIGDITNCNKMWAVWPASSPYVTSVGATQLVGSTEVVCSASTNGDITSGGGFSAVHDRSTKATWQTDVVTAYLAKQSKIPALSLFASTGRAYPDVSLIGNNYGYVDQGFTLYQSGTSASAPVFAGMISLLNDKRLSKGMSSLGFINPFLYWAAKKDSTSFTDIITGDNACSTFNKPCCSSKFSAASGWDAASGLGSPVFSKLAVLATQYPPSGSAATTTSAPSRAPSCAPSRSPTIRSTTKPPSRSPTKSPSRSPTIRSTTKPPSRSPTKSPSRSPTIRSTTKAPSKSPNKIPTRAPSKK